jgi:hypothetical protein
MCSSSTAFVICAPGAVQLVILVPIEERFHRKRVVDAPRQWCVVVIVDADQQRAAHVCHPR